MQVDQPGVEPAVELLEPALRISLPASFDISDEVPLSVHAEVQAQGGRIIGRAFPVFSGEDERPSFALMANDQQRNRNRLTKHTYRLILPLSPSALDHLEELRESHTRRDVVLRVNVFWSMLQSLLRAVQFNTFDADLRTAGGPAPPKGSKGLYISPTPSDTVPHFGMFASDSPPGFIRAHTQMIVHIIEIKSSDWAQVFRPALKRGHTVITEIPLPGQNGSSVQGPLAKIVSRAVDELREMDRLMGAHEWAKAIETSRKIVELARNDKVRKLMILDGFSNEAVEDFTKFLAGLADWQGKYIHTVSRGGAEVNQRLEPNREDAQLAYLTGVALVNMISRKAVRHASPNA